MAFVLEHFREGGESPIIEDGSIQVFVALRMLTRDHLSLTQITNHNSSLNQFVSNEMRRFVQRVSLLVAFLLSNPLVNVAQVNVPT